MMTWIWRGAMWEWLKLRFGVVLGGAAVLSGLVTLGMSLRTMGEVSTDLRGIRFQVADVQLETARTQVEVEALKVLIKEQQGNHEERLKRIERQQDEERARRFRGGDF